MLLHYTTVMRRSLSGSAAALLALAAAFTGAPPARAAGPALHAKIGMAQARTIALHREPGKIVSQELEREPDGSGLRYSFGIRGPKGLREVGIDAATGAVLEDSPDNGKD